MKKVFNTIRSKLFIFNTIAYIGIYFLFKETGIPDFIIYTIVILFLLISSSFLIGQKHTD